MTFKNKRAKRHLTYNKTECADCDLIIGVKWEKKYVGISPTRSHTKQKVCPLCNGNQVKTLKINETEFIIINQQWDMTDSIVTDDSETNCWLCE